MLSFHNLWDLEEQRGRGFINLSYAETEGEKTQTGTFMGRHKNYPRS